MRDSENQTGLAIIQTGDANAGELTDFAGAAVGADQQCRVQGPTVLQSGAHLVWFGRDVPHPDPGLVRDVFLGSQHVEQRLFQKRVFDDMSHRRVTDFPVVIVKELAGIAVGYPDVEDRLRFGREGVPYS